MSETGIDFIELKPSGLVFEKPISLTIPYQEYNDYDSELLSVFTYSETNRNWEWLEIKKYDKKSKIIEVNINHFSPVLAVYDEPLYLIMEIPGEFLLPGDILY